MKDKIDTIRAALVLRDFSAFELPEIIKDAIDYLVPALTPYEAALYW
ncbi:MAG: hypothetical protein ACE5JZ_07925 [Kiloniellales bacterium]